MTKHWQDPQPITPPDAFRQAIGGHPLIAETLYRRGHRTVEQASAFMHWHHYTPASPFDLPDMDRAVSRLQAAIRAKDVIGVWGDFDVDGQTSTALLVSALKDLGATVVSYIPQRLKEGHGLHLDSLKRFLDGGVQVLLTCDTGVDEHDAIHYANNRHVDVIVTDHHKLPPTLPNAHAIVNPQRLPVGHPLRDLPGVGVAYQLIDALAPDDYDTTPLLDLVALGIVADVAVQRGDTRYLLQRGLNILSDTRRRGLIEMMASAEINPVDVTEEDIAFRLAPRLNAIGRLGDANPTTDLLTTRSVERARLLVNQLEGLNAERRRLSDEVWEGVQAAIAREPYLLKHAALVVAHPSWHTGVVGIVANKCVERYNRPALLLATPADGPAKGSARSVAGVDITDAIAANADLLLGFGGHSMAAGVTLEAANVDPFRRGLSEQVLDQLASVDLTPTLQIDRYLPLDDLHLTLAEDVTRIAPFGPGNPPLTLASRGLTITSKRQLGRDARHQKLTLEDDVGRKQQVIWWNAEEVPAGRFDLAYTLRINTFRGQREVMIEWLDYRQDAQQPLEVQPPGPITYHDCRATPDPLTRLRELHDQRNGTLNVWAEVVTPEGVPSHRRTALTPSDALAVWVPPPDAATWEAALNVVRPADVYLFGLPLDVDQAQPFLTRLAGLVNYTLNQRDGVAPLTELAAMTAHHPRTVRAGLGWLVARGEIRVIYDDATVQLQRGDKQPRPTDEIDHATDRLHAQLDETAAYRAYWLRADQP